jgi:hypothetical protein
MVKTILYFFLYQLFSKIFRDSLPDLSLRKLKEYAKNIYYYSLIAFSFVILVLAAKRNVKLTTEQQVFIGVILAIIILYCHKYQQTKKIA